MPMFFLSGAMFPLAGLPSWLKIIVFVNPLTYGVDGIRRVMLGISSFPWVVDLGFLFEFSALALSRAVFFFTRGEY